MQKKRVMVIGVGAFGSAMVEVLWKAREVEVVVVDLSDAAVDGVKAFTDAAYVGDASNVKVLTDVGARDADTAVVSFGEDFEASVLCVAALRKIGVREIVARANTERQAEVLRAIGATRVLELEREMGYRIATEVTTIASSDLLDFAHGYRVVPWVATGDLVGKTLTEAALRKRYDVTVLGYGREVDVGGKPRCIVPATAEYAIRSGDVLMLVGEEPAIARFLAKY